MSEPALALPEEFPDYLKYSDEIAPVPSWEQVTRSVETISHEMREHLSRIITGSTDEAQAQAVWEAWPGNYRRSVGLLADKIYNEGWLDLVGQIEGYPWDGGFFFHPRASERGTFSEVMESKSGKDGAYTECTLRNGLFAYLNKSAHKGWQRGWMENNAPLAALHVGIFANGTAEVHFDAFNSLYTNGAPRREVIRIPLLGSFNHVMFRLHKRWEMSPYGAVARTSANFYYMLRDKIPLSF